MTSIVEVMRTGTVVDTWVVPQRVTKGLRSHDMVSTNK